LLVGSNAGFGKGSSWHWHLREACRVDPLWQFGRFEGPPARMTEARLAEQRRLLTPGSFNRVWLNQWQVGGGDSFSEETIRERCVFDGPLFRTPPGYHAGGMGLDLGLEKHHAAIVVVMVDCARERVRVARVQNFRPPVYLESVYQAILDLGKRFGIRCLHYDPWQAQHLAERLTAKGFTCTPRPSTAANMNGSALALWEAVKNKTLDLYPDPLLVEDLLGAEIVEQRNGFKLNLAENENGHSDRLAALCTVLPSAFEAAATMQPGCQSWDGLGSNLFGRGYQP